MGLSDLVAAVVRQVLEPSASAAAADHEIVAVPAGLPSLVAAGLIEVQASAAAAAAAVVACVADSVLVLVVFVEAEFHQ